MKKYFLLCISLIASQTFNTYSQSYLDKCLLNAVIKEDVDQTQQLLYLGADKDTTTDNGMTPLDYAADKKNLQIVQLLIAAGANPFNNHKASHFAWFIHKHERPGVQEIKIKINLLLENYERFFKEVQKNPTFDTLNTAVELGSLHFVKQLLIKLKPTEEQVRNYCILAYTKGIEIMLEVSPYTYRKITDPVKRTRNETNTAQVTIYKNLVRLLINYAHGLSLVKLENKVLPLEVAQIIAEYTLVQKSNKLSLQA